MMARVSRQYRSFKIQLGGLQPREMCLRLLRESRGRLIAPAIKDQEGYRRTHSMPPQQWEDALSADSSTTWLAACTNSGAESGMLRGNTMFLALFASPERSRTFIATTSYASRILEAWVDDPLAYESVLASSTRSRVVKPRPCSSFSGRRTLLNEGPELGRSTPDASERRGYLSQGTHLRDRQQIALAIPQEYPRLPTNTHERTGSGEIPVQ